ncbi:ShlB/FhaC/HecB family hemolysin secretion/activation protein [Pseudobowmanella zhangzhouensis]|uniref:ShlB/FhaC/HecB family hemolysin secretion/activation protein n=1 Tax=Pseudobowmanella zhangzhouensis TaxID=1537679 RepID=UPI0036196052
MSLDVLNNAYADEPLTLGGDSDFRGLPLQYQHGERTVKITNELRYYPHINLWRLFELGGAAFYDVGRVSGDAQIMPAYPGWLQSVGIGARFFPPTPVTVKSCTSISPTPLAMIPTWIILKFA